MTAATLRRGRPPCDADAIRVTGTLARDADLRRTTGTPPHLLLDMEIQPAQGLPYTARVDLGDDVANHMAAEAMAPLLRAGAVVSVAGRSLVARTDHGHAVLRVVDPHSVLVAPNRITTPAAPRPPQQEG